MSEQRNGIGYIWEMIIAAAIFAFSAWLTLPKIQS